MSGTPAYNPFRPPGATHTYVFVPDHPAYRSTMVKAPPLPPPQPPVRSEAPPADSGPPVQTPVPNLVPNLVSPRYAFPTGQASYAVSAGLAGAGNPFAPEVAVPVPYGSSPTSPPVASANFVRQFKPPGARPGQLRPCG